MPKEKIKLCRINIQFHIYFNDEIEGDFGKIVPILKVQNNALSHNGWALLEWPYADSPTSRVPLRRFWRLPLSLSTITLTNSPISLRFENLLFLRCPCVLLTLRHHRHRRRNPWKLLLKVTAEMSVSVFSMPIKRSTLSLSLHSCGSLSLQFTERIYFLQVFAASRLDIPNSWQMPQVNIELFFSFFLCFPACFLFASVKI